MVARDRWLLVLRRRVPWLKDKFFDEQDNQNKLCAFCRIEGVLSGAHVKIKGVDGP